jgi:predicted outer membrane protein
VHSIASSSPIAPFGVRRDAKNSTHIRIDRPFATMEIRAATARQVKLSEKISRVAHPGECVNRCDKALPPMALRGVCERREDRFPAWTIHDGSGDGMTIINGARTLALAAMAAALLPAAAAAQTATAEENSRAVHAFLSAVDLGEVRMSVLAQERATNPEVKAFAGRMVTDHAQGLQTREAQVKADGEGLFEAQLGTPQGPAGGEAAAGGAHAGHAQTGGAAPFTAAQMEAMHGVLAQHPLSRTMANSNQGNLQVLQGVNAGPQFDQTYMDAQIGAHRYALSQVDRMIAQGGVTDEMMATMRAMRAAIAQHLEQAQAIRGRL